MSRRVLIASSNPWSFCMAVERALARADAKAEVDAIDLFRLCGLTSPHWRRRDKLIETINRKIQRFVMPAINGRDITSAVNIDRSRFPATPSSYEELRAYEVEGAKIGLAVLSSASSLTTIQYPLNLAEYGDVLQRAWRSAHLSLRVGQAVKDLGYDRVIIFNGRHCYSRPFCDVLEGRAEVLRYEQGSAGNRYIAAAGSVHHPDALKQIIVGQPSDPEAGEAFFLARLEKSANTEVGLITAPQRRGQLPPGMRAGRAVTFFTSSSDEMFAVTDNPLYGTFPNQHAIALALVGICECLGLQLVLRLHPHLRFKHPAWQREWDLGELERQGVLILAPDDPADSYAMLGASQSVITTGSTIGLEASFLGIPNAVVGTWLPGSLGASVVAETEDDLARFIADPLLPAGARDAALRFGAFYRAGGTLLPELDVGTHPNFARIDGRIVDPVRYAVQTLRSLARRPHDPDALDIKSGMQAGRVLLPPGTDYSSAYGKAARSGSTKARRASTEKSLAGE